MPQPGDGATSPDEPASHDSATEIALSPSTPPDEAENRKGVEEEKIAQQ